MTESIETTEADALPWQPPAAPAITAMEPLPVTAATIEGARKILARLCNSGRVRMTVPPRDDDEDMILLAIIELAALSIAEPAAVLRPAPVQQGADAAPAANAPPLKGLAHFHYRLEAASGYEQEGVYNNITADGFGRVIVALEGARDDGRAALQPTQSAAPMPWPKARDVGRLGDMSPTASMRVGLDSDNDVYVAVYGDDGGGSVEFCTPGSGGGQSPRVREALIALMVVMEEENATSPSRDWWARRIGKPTQGKDAAS